LVTQVSLNQDIITDFPTDPGVHREATSWPTLQFRLASESALPQFERRVFKVGVWGHIGETGFDFRASGPPPLNLPPEDDARFLTWSFGADFHLPIGTHWGVQGEVFTGANLSPFLVGIGQGVCPCVREPIRSTGGWFEIWRYWTPQLHSHFGYGVDDPLNRDSLFGRSYNQFFFGNLVFEVSKRLQVGMEISYWKTFFQDRREGLVPPSELGPRTPGEAVVIDWMFKYSF